MISSPGGKKMSIKFIHSLFSRLSIALTTRDAFFIGLLRVSEYSDTRGSECKIEYEYSSLPKSLDRDLFFFFFLPFFN